MEWVREGVVEGEREDDAEEWVREGVVEGGMEDDVEEWVREGVVEEEREDDVVMLGVYVEQSSKRHSRSIVLESSDDEDDVKLMTCEY